MIHVIDLTDAERIRDLTIRRLVNRRLRELRNDEECGTEGNVDLAVVEEGDTIEALERETGCYIARGYFSSARFGNPEYSPSFEALEDHGRCYEIVFVLNDDGSGVLIFVPKQPDIDRELLTLCRTYAIKPVKRRR